jgi:hypothetical protein
MALKRYVVPVEEKYISCVGQKHLTNISILHMYDA